MRDEEWHAVNKKEHAPFNYDGERSHLRKMVNGNDHKPNLGG